MGKPDLLMKAKALAALEQGITTNSAKPIEALAAIADALGLEPDPAVLVLTEEEKEVLTVTLRRYEMERRVESQRFPDRIRESELRFAEIAQSLRQRLTGK